MGWSPDYIVSRLKKNNWKRIDFQKVPEGWFKNKQLLGKFYVAYGGGGIIRKWKWGLKVSKNKMCGKCCAYFHLCFKRERKVYWCDIYFKEFKDCWAPVFEVYWLFFSDKK